MKSIFPQALMRCGSLIFVLLLALGANAQTANDSAELTRLLNEFLAGASRNDVAIHDRFWADDVIYTGSGGRRRVKSEIMQDVRSAPAPKPGDAVTVFTAEDIRTQQYGETAIIAFRLVATSTKDSKTEVMNYLNSGTFVRRGGKWQVVNWQATKMSTPETGIKRDAAAAAESQPSVNLPAELARVLSDYEKGWRTGSAAALAELFTTDGFVLPNGKDAVKGRSAIQKLYTSNGAPLSLRAIAYALHGDVGYIIVGYAAEAGKPDDGKFTLTLRKGGDGRWLIVSDMDNFNHRP